MSSPPRGHARRTSSVTREGPAGGRRTSGAGSSIPVPNTSLRANRLAATQPSYDLLTGGHGGASAAPSPAVKPLGQSFRQSTTVRADIGNEDLRAQIKTLQYELDSLKRDRDVERLRHDKELRDATLKAEEVFQKARVEESAKQVPLHKYESLSRALKDAQDEVVNTKHSLEKRLRAAQEAERSAREEAEEAQNDLASLDRQNKYTMEEVQRRQTTLEKTLGDVRADLDAKSNTLKLTQDRLSRRDAEAGELESEILRLKAQTGDSETLGVIKRELSEQVAHIRQLEKVNKEQAGELKDFRKRHKAVEVVEEEKRVLESKLGLLDDAQKQLREAQLQRQILEDERSSWASYLENEGSTEYETPEQVAKALVRQRLENASLVQQRGELQAEQLEKDEMIKQLESQRTTIQSELEQLKANAPAGGNTSAAKTTASASDISRTKTRLEKQLNFAKKEVALMREQMRSFDSEEQTYHPDTAFDAAKSHRITELETMLDEHRQELADLTNELSTLETKASTTSPPKTPLKRPHPDTDEDEATDLVGQLSRKNRKLQDTLTALQSQTAILASEHAATRSQLHSLQNSSKTRILSLRSNPTSDHEALKASTLATLRRENKDLLATLQSRTGPPASSSGGAASSLVPVSALEALQLELRERDRLVADRDKRMLRLKQIWASKSLEVREAVYALLGWKMEFRADGKSVLSLCTKKSRRRQRRRGGAGAEEEGEEEEEEEEGEEESFIFDGERGTMKVSGGPESAFAREVRPFFKEWVEKRGFIPGLLASVLLGKVDDGTVAFD